MNFKEEYIRKTTESIDVDVRKFVLENRVDKESFNTTLKRLLNITGA